MPHLKPLAAADARASWDRLPALCPAQTHALDRLLEGLNVASLVGLMGRPGSGRSTLARHLALRLKARLITLSDVFLACQHVEPARWDEAVAQLLLDAVQPERVLVVDGYEDLLHISASAGVRGRFLQMVHRELMNQVVARRARLALTGQPPDIFMPGSVVFGDEAVTVQIYGFLPEDYAAILGGLLGAARVAKVDFKQVHRYASMLSAHQLRRLAAMMEDGPPALATADVVRAIQTHVLASNTRIEEVEALRFDSLPGTDHIAQALETHVILPFEQPELAHQMGLRPKRGVLLHGRPGTGKTSIGRALAHRIKGKFFLIDGNVNSEPPAIFFDQLQAIVKQAKAHAPSVLFIDDADVLFGIQHIAGLPRYLLSLLDGLESEGARDVCVVMTAMDPARIPAALLRSGRVELWLETRLPDAAARAAILARWLDHDLPDSASLDLPFLAQATEGFTAADLRRTAGDAKTLYAVDRVTGQPARGAMVYVASAINGVVLARRRMSELLGDDTLRIGHEIDVVPAPQS